MHVPNYFGQLLFRLYFLNLRLVGSPSFRCGPVHAPISPRSHGATHQMHFHCTSIATHAGYRGKLLNVREASAAQIAANQEIQNIKQILGLQHGKVRPRQMRHHLPI